MNLFRIDNNIYITCSEKPFSSIPYRTSAYFIRRNRGNFILYNSSYLQEYEEDLKSLGGVKARFLSHHHESSANSKWLSETFDAPTYAAKEESKFYQNPEFLRWLPIELEAEGSEDYFEIKATPGHTQGSYSYLWEKNNHRYLFTGDSLFLDKNNQPTIITSIMHDAQALKETLIFYQSVRAPFLFCASGTMSKTAYLLIRQQEKWEAFLDLQIKRLHLE